MGASYFLNKLKNNYGPFLALTGTRLKGKELVQIGVADYYIESSHLKSLEKDLIENVNENCNKNNLNEIISKYSTKIDEEYKNYNDIKQIFSFSEFQSFYENINKSGEIGENFLKSIQNQCPLSVRVIFEQLKRGKNLSVEECFKMDFRICQKLFNIFKLKKINYFIIKN